MLFELASAIAHHLSLGTLAPPIHTYPLGDEGIRKPGGARCRTRPTPVIKRLFLPPLRHAASSRAVRPALCAWHSAHLRLDAPVARVVVVIEP